MTSHRRKIRETERAVRKMKKARYKDYRAVKQQCLKKNTYGSYRFAENLAKRQEINRGYSIHVYVCNICGLYHLAHGDGLKSP